MSSVKCWWPTLMIGIMHENHALLLNKGPTIEIWVRVLSPNSSQTPVLYFSKSTFLTFSSQIPTNSVNLTRFLPFPYMRNIEYLRGTLSSHENYHILTMRNGKTTEILSSLLWDSHKILWGIFVRVSFFIWCVMTHPFNGLTNPPLKWRHDWTYTIISKWNYWSMP